MRYDDAPKMIDWLCNALGFARHLVVEDGAGGIAHAQLTRGNSMIMLGSARDDEFGAHQSTARALGGISQSPYIVVDDVDAVCEQARNAGAEITTEPKDEDYGGRLFSCRDPEGQLWTFGSYDPWNAHK
ncbi:VOC family protein [Paracoccus aerodenitrificans]|uniref:VOC family protein n=1 Tax=Paracoccus aerodenitrificans TaxID=3017781 RepID=UPI0022F016EF|nr:VOC family protein [Paracoccus aerodenitrificans]WBU64326.1 VOC family protein [Paracoccus aerodenitrificans]